MMKHLSCDEMLDFDTGCAEIKDFSSAMSAIGEIVHHSPLPWTRKTKKVVVAEWRTKKSKRATDPPRKTNSEEDGARRKQLEKIKKLKRNLRLSKLVPISNRFSVPRTSNGTTSKNPLGAPPRPEAPRRERNEGSIRSKRSIACQLSSVQEDDESVECERRDDEDVQDLEEQATPSNTATDDSVLMTPQSRSDSALMTPQVAPHLPSLNENDVDVFTTPRSDGDIVDLTNQDSPNDSTSARASIGRLNIINHFETPRATAYLNPFQTPRRTPVYKSPTTATSQYSSDRRGRDFVDEFLEEALSIDTKNLDADLSMDESIRTEEIDEIIDLSDETFNLEDADNNECREGPEPSSEAAIGGGVKNPVIDLYVAACRLQGLEDNEIMKNCNDVLEKHKSTIIPDDESVEIIDIVDLIDVTDLTAVQ